MRLGLFLVVLAAVLASAVFASRSKLLSGDRETVFEPANRPPPLAPMCPWRDPGADLPKLFPEASAFQPETRVLSGMRPELAQRLGRMPAPDENAVQVYRIREGDRPLGEVMTRRVKGTFGALELVVAAGEGGGLKGILVQRTREPEAATQALLAMDWTRWLGGKTAESSWNCEELIASLPPEAHDSARAVVEGARTAMILLAVSRRAPPINLAHSHNH